MAKGNSGRKLRNFMLNKKLQLSFALFMLGVTALLCGTLITVTVYEMRRSRAMFTRQRREDSKMFAKQRKEATKMFARQRREATNIMEKQLKVATDMLDVMKMDESLKDAVEVAQKDIRDRDAQRVATRSQQDKELARRRAEEDKEMKARRERLDREMEETMRRSTIILAVAMVGGCAVFLVALFLYGIVLTHKVAGPLFKISRHMDEVRRGELKDIWGLRKGDQLVEFFDHFKKMHDALKDRRVEDIELLAEVLEELKKAETDEAEAMKVAVEKRLNAKKETLEVVEKPDDGGKVKDDEGEGDSQDEGADGSEESDKA